MSQAFADAQPLLPEIVEQLILARTGGRVRDLRVEVTDREIILLGRTSTYYSKQLATHAVLDSVEGVSLTNDIEVR